MTEDLIQRRETLEKELEDAFLEVKGVLKNDQVYQRWRADIAQRIKGLPVLIPMLADCVRKVANDMRTDKVYLREIYNLYR